MNRFRNSVNLSPMTGWTPTTSEDLVSSDPRALLSRCRVAWITACTAWAFAAIVAVTALFMWANGGAGSLSPMLIAIVGMMISVGIMGGIGYIDRAGLSDEEQSIIATSSLPPAIKAMLAVALEQGFWAFHRVLPVVRQHLATHQPGSRALSQFKLPRDS